MKCILAALLVLTLATAASAQSDGADAYERGDYRTAYEEWLPIAMADYVRITSYRGDLGENIIIQMDLQFKNAPQITGSYFYKRWLKDIPLKGRFLSEREIEIQEFDSRGKPSGTFNLHFREQDPRERFGNSALDREVITGHWQSADGIRSLPVYLRALGGTIFKQGSSRYAVAGSRNDALLERSVQGFYQAVLNGDREAVARYVQYPLAFTLDGTRRQVWNTTAFLRYYSSIFTPQFVAKIADGIPHNMFANYQGIMIAEGAVWFDEQGKASVFNN